MPERHRSKERYREAPVPDQAPRDASLDVEVNPRNRAPRNHLPENKDTIINLAKRAPGGASEPKVPPVEESLRRSPTIGEGGDTTISSPGRSPKQHLPGIGLHDPLHGRQTCPEFIAFDHRGLVS